MWGLRHGEARGALDGVGGRAELSSWGWGCRGELRHLRAFPGWQAGVGGTGQQAGVRGAGETRGWKSSRTEGGRVRGQRRRWSMSCWDPGRHPTRGERGLLAVQSLTSCPCGLSPTSPKTREALALHRCPRQLCSGALSAQPQLRGDGARGASEQTAPTSGMPLEPQAQPRGSWRSVRGPCV